MPVPPGALAGTVPEASTRISSTGISLARTAATCVEVQRQAYGGSGRYDGWHSTGENRERSTQAKKARRATNDVGMIGEALARLRVGRGSKLIGERGGRQLAGSVRGVHQRREERREDRIDDLKGGAHLWTMARAGGQARMTRGVT